MNSGILRFCATAILAITISACEQIPGVGGSSTAVIDLSAVAKATGVEERIQQQAQAAREELNAELAETAAQLEAQLVEERENLGEAPSVDAQQQFQQMAQQAQQQYAQAQQQAQQFETNLVLAFREKIKPVAETVAKSRGAGVVFLADVTLFWFEPRADITDEVIGKLRADPSILASEAAPEVAPESGLVKQAEPAEPAPATTE